MEDNFPLLAGIIKETKHLFAKVQRLEDAGKRWRIILKRKIQKYDEINQGRIHR